MSRAMLSHLNLMHDKHSQASSTKRLRIGTKETAKKKWMTKLTKLDENLLKRSKKPISICPHMFLTYEIWKIMKSFVFNLAVFLLLRPLLPSIFFIALYRRN